MPSRESSLRNLEKARAKWRPPRPWRCSQESQMIRRFVFQWFTRRDRSRPSGRDWAGSLASATRGYRSWFGNLRKTQAKCGGYKEQRGIPNSPNSPARKSTAGN